MTNLKLDWCSYEAAKYAVEKWHYSHSMPAGKTVKIGVWEAGQFIGCVIFSRGANNNIGKPYELDQTEICELTRVALYKHMTPVSRIVAIAIKMLKKQSPGVRMIVSYADTAQGHAGKIYQAMNWIYVGAIGDNKESGKYYLLNGKKIHGRTLRNKFGSAINAPVGTQSLYITPKHKYLYPLDVEMAQKIKKLSKPYPKHAAEVNGVTSDNQSEEGSSSLTQPLIEVVNHATT